MEKTITKRQKDLLDIIYRYIKDTGYPPTFEEMRTLLGVTSNQSVIDLLNQLEKKKIVKRNESAARGIVILPLGYEALGEKPLVPFLGISHAGAPIDMFEITGEWRPLSNEVSQLSNDVFLLKISGDSMINAGIDDGDRVLVEVRKEFSTGDIVLANLDGKSTVKRFISDDHPPFVYLKPENPSYPIIPFTHKMRLIGKVISILKQEQWKGTN